MIVYLDTSALIKLYVQEIGSKSIRSLVNASSVVATSKVAYVEARAALARAQREGILDENSYHLVVGALKKDWASYLSVEVSEVLITLAGDLAEQHRLRGFDAIHLASAVTIRRQVKRPVIVCCWDTRLWESLRASEFDTLPEEQP
ncbi:MAG: type II toxin-antitoxin system VapC family toxin [Eubacteriales bacterium]|nr:type II toxin-antitoxin system VapC family toxin [Bacillota bacterium]MBV1726803.1 type II toxin-antitoxin system VapC family toxin [Desulforudis sp.]MBV1735798.1 type II toxin-antitoxin system VapC family toxin [Desulforudis sp.]MDZ4043015.1 type II toxin-antitoxin system VapC family toxin [Eubacteriales bacterium]MDZ7610356.1 type II toxin-antitoxin system VapC family toxin [Eubacteriales bacterium]